MFGERLGAGASFGAAQVIANERGQGRYCSRGVCRAVQQLAEDVLDARTSSATPVKPVKPPALPSAALRRSVPVLAAAARPNVPWSSSCIDDGRATTLPLLHCCPPCGLHPGARPCMPNSTTRLVPRHCERKLSRPDTRNAALSWPTGQPCCRLARVAAKGRGQGGSTTYSTAGT